MILGAITAAGSRIYPVAGDSLSRPRIRGDFHAVRRTVDGGFKSEVQPRYDASVASSRRLRGVF